MRGQVRGGVNKKDRTQRLINRLVAEIRLGLIEEQRPDERLGQRQNSFSFSVSLIQSWSV